MNELHKTFHVLGLEPGATFEVVKRRYKRLVLVWHPDRMANVEGKAEAEEELKKINNSFDKLKKHFESNHTQGSNCDCQPDMKFKNEAGSNSKTDDTESHADKQEYQSKESDTASKSYKNNSEWIYDENLRWKVTKGLVATFILLVGFCWVGCVTSDIVHFLQRQLEPHHYNSN